MAGVLLLFRNKPDDYGHPGVPKGNSRGCPIIYFMALKTSIYKEKPENFIYSIINFLSQRQ